MISPFGFGLVPTFFIYFGILFMFNRPSIEAPTWLWFAGLPILMVSLWLQVWGKRMLWLRLYQTLTMGIAGFTNAVALWLVWQRIQPELNLLIGFIVIVVFWICIALSYSKTLRQNRAELVTMPHGLIGTIMPTGIINPEITPDHITKRNQARVRKDNQLQKWIPLIIGLSFFIRRVYGQTGNLVTLILAFTGIMVLCCMFAGSFAVYVIAIRRWEQQHHLRLYLQRR